MTPPSDAPAPSLGTTLRAVAPNQPKTPLRSFRIPHDLYERAQDAAALENESVSDVVRRELERYAKRVERKHRDPESTV